MVRTYRGATLENATGVELVIALYDGLIRFLGNAADAAERGDVQGRRDAARRSLDILIHLQATLRPEVGGKPAAALAEFYASIFATILRASQAAAPGEFHHAIRCVLTVREAWQQVAADPAVQNIMPRDLQTQEEKVQSRGREIAGAAARSPIQSPSQSQTGDAGGVASRWMA